ncbi:hypothetical protein, partial [Candidatus Symbiothrix dinenymphae]|uniref:hypothetical protein n=1 Tax=Candidatus Symbiothrix dinenymphae TaxID=467085 RepID=UPI001D057242
MIRPSGIVFPPLEVVSKLVKSGHTKDFSSENQIILTKELGYYSNLQSIKSEDAITWSLFGYIAYQDSAVRDKFFNELLRFLHLDEDKNCQIKLWQRLPHPDNFS